jgi:hypothetical protein
VEAKKDVNALELAKVNVWLIFCQCQLFLLTNPRVYV